MKTVACVVQCEADRALSLRKNSALRPFRESGNVGNSRSALLLNSTLCHPSSVLRLLEWIVIMWDICVRTLTLPLVLYGCETWFLILRTAHRLRVFENRVPMKILGPKVDEVKGGWRNLRNEERHNLYSSLGIIRFVKIKRTG
jgi:hypothetical protein